MRRLILFASGLLAACTPGGLASSNSGAWIAATTITVNLTLEAPSSTAYGTSGGYAPAVTVVPVGSTIRFVNTDGFAHTATLIPGASSFPPGSPFTASALTQAGTAISQPWSTGSLAAGAASQTITIDRAGVYLYGCFYHYGAPMRGAIVAQ